MATFICCHYIFFLVCVKKEKIVKNYLITDLINFCETLEGSFPSATSWSSPSFTSVASPPSINDSVQPFSYLLIVKVLGAEGGNAC